MTRKKYKMTGCARLFFVLIILIPAAYFGAKLIRGGEGIPVIDEWIDSITNTADDQAIDPNTTKTLSTRDFERLRKDNLLLQKRVDELIKENDALREELKRVGSE